MRKSRFTESQIMADRRACASFCTMSTATTTDDLRSCVEALDSSAGAGPSLPNFREAFREKLGP